MKKYEKLIPLFLESAERRNRRGYEEILMQQPQKVCSID